MNENHFDKSIRGKLAEHESRVPEHLWNNIQKDLQKKRTTPVFPFALMTVALLSVGAVIIYFMLSNDAIPFQSGTSADKTHIEATSSNTNSTGRNGALLGEDANYTTDVNDQDTGTSQDESDKKGPSEKNSTELSLTSEATSSATTTSRPNETDAGQTTNSAQGSTSSNVSVRENGQENGRRVSKEQTDNIDRIGQEIGRQSESSPSAGSDSKNSSTSIKSSSPSATLNSGTREEGREDEIENVADKQVIATQDGQTNSPDVSDDLTKSAVEGQTNPSDLSDEEIANILSERQVKEVGPLPQISDGSGLTIGHFVYDPCSVKGGKKKNRVHCYSFVAERKKVFADFEIGPQYSHKILRSRGDLEHDQLLSDRRSTESYQFAYNVTARVGVKLTSGLTGMAGLSYDRIQEQFDFYDPNARRQTVTHVIQDTIVASDDSIVIVWDTFMIESEGQRTVKHSNKLSFISIPLTAGYTWEMKKFNVGFHGGISVNLMFEQSGRIMSPDGEVVSLNGAGAKDVFKTSAGLGLLGGLIFEYHLDDGLSFIAESRFNYQLSNLTTDNYMLEQNYLNFGLNVGLRKVLYQKTIHKKKYGID